LEATLRPVEVSRTDHGLTSLVLKVSARCNLACPYCYMFFHADQSWRQRPARISLDVVRTVALRLREYCASANRRVSISLHGGEPLLVGKEHFISIVTTLRDVLGDYLPRVSVQTNAVLIDAEWAAILRDLRVLVGISLDGPMEIHDRARPDHGGRGSFHDVIRGIELLQQVGKNPGILSVVSPDGDGAAIYRMLRQMGISDLAFLLPDATHDSHPRLYGIVPRGAIARFLIDVLDAWLEEDDADVSVRPLKGLIRAMFGGFHETDAFGSPALTYATVDTDGSVETIDALRVCDPGVSQTGVNLMTGTFQSLFAQPGFAGQLFRQGAGIPDECHSCPEVGICGGGYVAHRYSREFGFARRSVWCDEILILLNAIRERIGSMEVLEH
jgi:uncharacterized protein